jgi:hypothetical protein
MAKKQPAPVRSVARLDPRGVLIAVETVAATAPLDAATVPLPDGHDMDKRIGRYRWVPDAGNPQGGAFMPLARAGSADMIKDEPDVVGGIAAAFMALHLGRPLPAATLAWLDAYARSIDGATEDAELIRLFADWRGRKV